MVGRVAVVCFCRCSRYSDGIKKAERFIQGDPKQRLHVEDYFSLKTNWPL